MFLVDEKVAVSLIIGSLCGHCLTSCGVVKGGLQEHSFLS